MMRVDIAVLLGFFLYFLTHVLFGVSVYGLHYQVVRHRSSILVLSCVLRQWWWRAWKIEDGILG